MPLTLVFWFAVGCGTETPSGNDNGSDCTDVFYADADGDGHGDRTMITTACSAPSGFTTTDDDCDDTNPVVHPGADEICDELDDDCNGTVDVDAVDAPSWYPDDDGDGYGDDSKGVVRCPMPTGYVSVGGDCADSDSSIHPGADELCNGVDDDCDGLLNGLDPSLVDGLPWYADTDGDGYGDPAGVKNDCAQPSGYVEVAGDCDDTNAATSPDGHEVCNAIDDDCDGQVDDCTMDPSDADALVEGTLESGGSGFALAIADVNGDGIGDLLNGAPGPLAYGPSPGAEGGRVYVSFGPLSGTVLAGDDITITSPATTTRGDAVGGGDADGDGYDDVLAATFLRGDSVSLLLGPITADRSTSTAELEVYSTSRTSAYTGAVSQVTSDMDGDGANDILITAPHAEGDGAVYVMKGTTTGAGEAETFATYVFEGNYDYLGMAAADLGDMDGDGIDELSMTGWTEAYVVTGGMAPGTYDASSAATTTVAPLYLPNYGNPAANITSTDFDHDGYDDLLVGDIGDVRGDAFGVVDLFPGPLAASIEPERDAIASWVGDGIGWILATGDCNGDMEADLFVSGEGNAQYLGLGPATGVMRVEDMMAFPLSTFGGLFLPTLSFTPDWSGDDVQEIALAGNFATTTAGGAEAGAVYVYYSERFY